ncbi:hypothetical protein KUCAC02_032327, partial [Chaenocephalus aceratus]
LKGRVLPVKRGSRDSRRLVMRRLTNHFRRTAGYLRSFERALKGIKKTSEDDQRPPKRSGINGNLRRKAHPITTPLRSRELLSIRQTNTSTVWTSAVWTSAMWTSAVWTSAVWTSAVWTSAAQHANGTTTMNIP